MWNCKECGCQNIAQGVLACPQCFLVPVVVVTLPAPAPPVKAAAVTVVNSPAQGTKPKPEDD